MNFDTLIIGGGAAGISCALVLGSALDKPFSRDRKVGIIMHQKASHLQSALLNNALGVAPGTPGKDVLVQGVSQLEDLYPQVEQILKQKVKAIEVMESDFMVRTNKSEFRAKHVVIAVGYTDTFSISGLEEFVEQHGKSKPSKNRIQLRNKDHLVVPGLYVAGTLAGHRSQFAIAAGSGAAVATDILTLWNQGIHTKVHDKL